MKLERVRMTPDGPTVIATLHCVEDDCTGPGLWADVTEPKVKGLRPAWCNDHKPRLFGMIVNPWGGLTEVWLPRNDAGEEFEELSFDECEELGLDGTIRRFGVPVIREKGDTNATQ